ASGDMVSDVETDEFGTASAANIPSGATAVLVVPVPTTGAPSKFIFGIFGIQPGDDIHFEAEPGDGMNVGTMTVHLPVYIGASSFEVSDGCGYNTNASPDVTVYLREGCVNQGHFDMVGRALDAGGAPLAFVHATGTFSDGGDFTPSVSWGSG